MKDIRLGDYVRTNGHGHLGRVTRKDHLYNGKNGVGERDWWTDGLEIPITDEQLKENWVSVLCKGGGSIYTFEGIEDYKHFDKYWMNLKLEIIKNYISLKDTINWLKDKYKLEIEINKEL